MQFIMLIPNMISILLEDKLFVGKNSKYGVIFLLMCGKNGFFQQHKKVPLHFGNGKLTTVDDRARRALSVVKISQCSIVAALNAPNRHFAHFCRKTEKI